MGNTVISAGRMGNPPLKPSWTLHVTHLLGSVTHTALAHNRYFSSPVATAIQPH